MYYLGHLIGVLSWAIFILILPTSVGIMVAIALGTFWVGIPAGIVFLIISALFFEFVFARKVLTYISPFKGKYTAMNADNIWDIDVEAYRAKVPTRQWRALPGDVRRKWHGFSPQEKEKYLQSASEFLFNLDPASKALWDWGLWNEEVKKTLFSEISEETWEAMSQGERMKKLEEIKLRVNEDKS